jgi:hypothetical protein
MSPAALTLDNLKSEPEAVFKTTAGELRRRNAGRQPAGLTLGSNWKNEDTLFIVILRGVFPHRMGPLLWTASHLLLRTHRVTPASISETGDWITATMAW